jgi:plasmid stabilization system protein ParE
MKITKKAKQEIAKNIRYIAQKGNPYNAEKLYDRMLAFIPSLRIMPEKYAFCRHSKFANKKYRCATFEQTYIFVYAIHIDKVLLLRVMHGLKLS